MSERLRAAIGQLLNFAPFEGEVSYSVLKEAADDGYRRLLVTYLGDEDDEIPAYLLLPEGKGPFPAVLIHHQHHGQRHLGKSEVCGLAGDPLQAFGPALARQGLVVLAPDAVCFEDRRRQTRGIEPDDLDVAQHFNEMSYRLLRGDTLMRKVLDDGSRGLSLLLGLSQVDPERVGVLGHSMGGSTVLFQMALEERIKFGCSSGALCSYAYMMANEIGIEMSLTVPGFTADFEKVDLVRCIAPRPFLVVSAEEDKYSADANINVDEAMREYEAMGAGAMLEHARYEGDHPLTQERFDRIVSWISETANR